MELLEGGGPGPYRGLLLKRPGGFFGINMLGSCVYVCMAMSLCRMHGPMGAPGCAAVVGVGGVSFFSYFLLVPIVPVLFLGGTDTDAVTVKVGGLDVCLSFLCPFFDVWGWDNVPGNVTGDIGGLQNSSFGRYFFLTGVRSTAW